MGQGATPAALVTVVDDDPSIRLALDSLLRALGFLVEVFPSAEDFLDSKASERRAPACLVVDVGLPGMNGFDLLRRLSAAGCAPPTIFISAREDTLTKRETLSAGGMAFLLKPFPEDLLVSAVQDAITSSHERATSKSTQSSPT
jgi:FixJ family two-component response regulator